MKKQVLQFSKRKYKCIQEGHEDEKLLFVCVKQNCDALTRLSCQKCITGSHQKHVAEHIPIKDLETFQDQQKELIHPAAQQILQQIQQFDQNQIQKQLDNIFESFQNQFLQNLQKYKKELSSQFQVNQNKNNGLDMGNIIEKLQKEFDITKINEFIQEIDQNNQQSQINYLTQWLKSQNFIQKLENSKIYNKMFEQIPKKDQIFLKNLQIGLQQKLSDLEQYFVPLLFQQQQNQIEMSNNPKIRFKKSQSSKYIKIEQNNIKQINTYGWNVVYSDSFKKTENIFIQIKFLQVPQNFQRHITMGIIKNNSSNIEEGHQQWGDSGNQFNFDNINNNKLPSKEASVTVKGSASQFLNLVKPGFEICFEINVCKNIMKMFDINQENIFENTYIFEEEELWRFIIDNYYFPFEIQFVRFDKI